MKILAISTVPIKKNGLTNVMAGLISACMLENPDVSFDICAPLSAVTDLERVKCLPVKSPEKVFMLERSIKNPSKYIKALTKAIKEGGYDSVHIHSNSHTCVLELIAAQKAGCEKRIVHAHNSSCNHMVLHKLMTKKFDSLCTHRLACSDKAGAFMHGEHEFTVINNGVDCKRFSFCDTDRAEVRSQLALKGKIALCHVGAFNPAKNHSFLLDIMAGLEKKAPGKYKLLCLGEGTGLEEAKEKAARLGISGSVIFAGSKSNVEQYLSAVDLVLLPSLFEGLPLSLVEQQASGLCALVSDSVTKQANITGNITYLPIDKGADLWVDAILNEQTDYKRYLMSAKAVNIIREKGFDIGSSAKAVLEIYNG